MIITDEKILIIGASGLLGSELAKQIRSIQGTCLLTPSHSELDITKEDEINAYFVENRPSLVYLTAAYTDVKKAETEPELCMKINVLGAEKVAKACEKVGAKLVYISTDYVFDGLKGEPYDTEDEPSPVNVYCKSKAMGEKAVKEFCSRTYIVRTGWLYGETGNDFVKKMIKLSETRQEVKVVCDQYGAPTEAGFLCEKLLKVPQHEYGIYHITGEWQCSWADFAKKIFDERNIDCRVIRVSTKEYADSVARPMDTRLKNSEI